MLYNKELIFEPAIHETKNRCLCAKFTKKSCMMMMIWLTTTASLPNS